MLRLNALRILRNCAKNNKLMYDTDSFTCKKLIKLSKLQLLDACKFLEEKKYIKVLSYSMADTAQFKLTYKGRAYKESFFMEYKEIIVHSVFIPIVVTLATAFIISNFIEQPSHIVIEIQKATPSTASEATAIIPDGIPIYAK